MYKTAALLIALIVLANPIICNAQSKQIPKELEGVWISTDASKNYTNMGGAILEKGQKEGLCRSLAGDPFYSHNFEGVLVLRDDKMIYWSSRCDIFGGFKKSGANYTSNYRCRGEHGTYRGRVTFHLEINKSETILSTTLMPDRGDKYADYYDDKCK